MSDVTENPVEIHNLYEYTPLIRTSDMGYPKYLRDFRKDNPNVTMTVNYIDANIVALYNYFEVLSVEAPTEGDVITEGKPELRDDGKWYQTWTVRAFTVEEIAQNLVDAKDRALMDANTIIAQDLSVGVTVKHGDVDYRVSSTTDERVNWGNDLFILMNRDNAAEFSVRVMDESITMTVAEATTFYHNAIENHFQLLTAYYNYIDAVSATVLIADLPVTPGSFFEVSPGPASVVEPVAPAPAAKSNAS